jgi:DNA-binding winged helix-turn-helix (wHTH) protein
MTELKRQLVDKILSCQDEQLLQTVARLLQLEQKEVSLPAKKDELIEHLNQSANNVVDQDALNDIQGDIDDVFG